ncbi:unnamed protein product [Parascedosporium putredinis]|uniref:Uncharacterized protein n=1 Tax=Parascedosporium putredinis TaxID=1442378 RepID=A0A9P1HAB7_9PEZI|nr:unnamed protein product [Parascedosporium putredinis]CAI8001710.1 unnamed protein product [Parascedosporium putredinis]
MEGALPGAYNGGSLVDLRFDETCTTSPTLIDNLRNGHLRTLEQRRGSLRKIRFDVCDNVDFGPGDRSSLTDFARLEVLQVNGHALGAFRQAWRSQNPHAKIDSFLSTMLPPSASKLVLWSPDALDLGPAVLRLARVVEIGRYPALKSISILPSEGSSRDSENWIHYSTWAQIGANVSDSLATIGVQFSVKSQNGYWGHEVEDV